MPFAVIIRDADIDFLPSFKGFLRIRFRSGHVVRDYPNWYKATIRNRSMAAVPSKLRISTSLVGRYGVVSLIVTLIAAIGLAGISFAANNSVQGAKKEDTYDLDAPTAILIEANSGSILFEKNADELRAPSSMLKLMTAEVIFNALTEGKIKLDDEYKVSANAWRKGGAPSGGSTMFAEINSKVKVDDLLHGALIQSGNDACIALAEGSAGHERDFVEVMKDRARELGLTKSTFGNPTGLPDPANKMTVRELAMLARHIILTYPEFYKLFNEREFTWNKIRQQNRNPLLTMLEGADGLKTGYTKDGGYGLVGSAVQNGTRLIVVVNGLEDPEDRASEAKKLLEWGFRNFEPHTLFAADQIVGYAKVFGGESRSVKLSSSEPINVMVARSGGDKLIARIVYSGPVRAPIQSGQRIGALKVWRGNNLALEAPLFAAESIGPGSTTRRAIDGASELVIGLFRAGAEKL
jgi:D-alanyl-D-alanine carboxypeptidase (penicillin-binding protein 5/6)